MRRRIHVHLDVRGALRTMGRRDLGRLFRDADGRRVGADAAREILLDALADGYAALPIGKPCEGFDRLTGCPGHDVPDDETEAADA